MNHIKISLFDKLISPVIFLETEILDFEIAPIWDECTYKLNL